MENSSNQEGIYASKSLEPIHHELMIIANEIFNRNHVFTSEELFRLAKRKINKEPFLILNGINFLLTNKIFLEGSKLTREQILLNENRKNILEFIIKNPGSNVNDVIKEFNLGPHSVRWHISMLKKFGYIKSTKILNNVIFFEINFPEEKQEIAFVLKRPKSQKILNAIMEHQGINMTGLAEITETSFSTLSYNIDILEGIELVKKTKNGKRTQVFLNENKIYVINELIKPKKELKVSEVEVLRAFDYVGGKVRFKVAIQNNSNSVVTHISCSITSTNQFNVDTEMQRIDILSPNESRGMDFMLEPLTCGKSEIFGTISYKDSKGIAHSSVIQPLEVWIKCPLVEAEELDLKSVERLKNELVLATQKIEFGKLSRENAFTSVKNQVSGLDLLEIYYNIDQLRLIYSGIAKITDDVLILEITTLTSSIKIDVYTRDIKQATGFLAWLQNLISINFETQQKLYSKNEKIGKRLRETLELSKILDILIENCENEVTIQEIINVINEIVQRLSNSFGELKEIKIMKRFKEKLMLKHGIDEKIPIKIQQDIIYNSLSLLERLLEICKSDGKLFLNNIDNEKDLKIQEEKLEELINNFEQHLESHYKRYLNQIVKYIIVIMKSSGLAIITERISGKEFDGDLISGFIQAIQSFGQEIHENDTSVSKMVYQDFELTMEEGEFIRTAIITSNESINLLINNTKEFVKEFEEKHREDLELFTGNVQKFNKSVALIHKFFKF